MDIRKSEAIKEGKEIIGNKKETIADLTAEDEKEDEEFELDEEPAALSAGDSSDDITLEDLEEAVS